MASSSSSTRASSRLKHKVDKKRKHIEVEYESEDVDTKEAVVHIKKDIKTRKGGRIAKEDAKVIEKEVKKGKGTPKNWLEVWEAISQMRSKKDAPVDTLGCEGVSLREAAEDPKKYRFAVLLSLMLSSQTKDAMTAKAMGNLGEYGLSVQRMIDIPDDTLDGLIKCVGFHNRKTIYIKKTAQILHDKYDDDVPATLEEVLELPGGRSKKTQQKRKKKQKKEEIDDSDDDGDEDYE